MIELSNGHRLEFVAASGALGFDGRGWPWEWPLRWFGLLDPHLFTVVIKTLFLDSWKGNLRWRNPWRVLKFISDQGKVIHPLLALIRPNLVGGLANAVGLTSPGLGRWLKRDYPVIQRHNYKVIVSISGKEGEGCVEMIKILNGLKNVVGVEFNASCPSTNLGFLKNAERVVRICHALKEASNLPLLLKLSFIQPYTQIAKDVEGKVEAISINSVPWDVVFPGEESPLAEYGGGGVSGRITQPFTWKMVSDIARETNIPVIGPSIWEYEDIQRVEMLGASAHHFGSIFLPYPRRPTMYVKRWMCE